MKSLVLLPVMFFMFPFFLIVVGTILGIISLFVLNWGPSAAYDYTGNRMIKKEENAKKTKTKKTGKSNSFKRR